MRERLLPTGLPCLVFIYIGLIGHSGVYYSDYDIETQTETIAKEKR